MQSRRKTFRCRVGSSSFSLLCLLILSVAACTFPADTVTSPLLIGGSRIDVNVDEGQLHTPKEDVMKWVQWAAESVATYYGHFPLPHVSIGISPFGGTGVRGGRTFVDHGGRILIHMGRKSTF